MDRNIITQVDVVEGTEPAIRGTETTPPDKADDRFQKLLKFIPSESIGLYVGLDGVIRSAENDPFRLRLWLSAVLVVCVLFTWLYLRRFWRVTRLSQVAVSTAALVAYVFAIGGVFREFPFYRPWESSAVLVLATAFLIFFTPPEPIAPRKSSSNTKTKPPKT